MNHCWLKGYKVTASVCVPRLSVVSDEMILSHCQQHCYHPISIISVITVSHCCSTLGLHQTEVIPVSDPHHILILATNNSLVRGYEWTSSYDFTSSAMFSIWFRIFPGQSIVYNQGSETFAKVIILNRKWLQCQKPGIVWQFLHKCKFHILRAIIWCD